MPLFEKNQNWTPKIKIGHPCLNCPPESGHTHLDHSMYDPQHCLIVECPCKGLKLDVKPISRKP
jgi:hypothetical protein